MKLNSEDGFVDIEFFEQSFSSQVKFYRDLIKQNSEGQDDLGIFVFPPEPIVEAIYLPSFSEVDKKLAYSAEYSAQIIHDEKNNYGQKVLQGVSIPSGMEMIDFTFGIKRCSRVFTHQIVRHRLAKISQSNSRDRIVPPLFVLPFYGEGYLYDYYWMRRVCTSYRDSYLLYLDLIDKGHEPQDARYVLPDAICQSLVFDIDFKTLQSLCSLRLCLNMQPEMVFVSWMMKNIIDENFPELGKMLSPVCDKMKKCSPIQCNVYDGCGKWPVSVASKTGKKPCSQTSNSKGWVDLRDKFFACK
jgi:thymidylate synthase (FAD)